MRILLVSKCPTHPTIAGNRYWILTQAELLMQMGHEVHFLFIYEPPFQRKHSLGNAVELMRSYWNGHYHQYRIPLYEKCYNIILDKIRKYLNNYTWKCDDGYPHGLHHIVNKLDRKYHFDCCIVNYFYLSKLFEHIHIPKKALSSHDCFTYKSLVVGQKAIHSLKPNSEAKAMQRSPYIFALQDEEALFFQMLSPRSKVLNVYGIYDFHEQPCRYNKNILFFSGGNEYNVNGLMWFLKDIFPLIVGSFPDVKLVVGGSICNLLDEYSDNPNIQLVGFVDNPADFFMQGDVAINPTYQGTGLKIKTFESLSYGKVVMVHPHSTKGIYRRNNAPLFSSDQPVDWLEFLKKLWSGSNEVSVEIYKEHAKQYISDLKEYVVSSYQDFLGTDKTNLQ